MKNFTRLLALLALLFVGNTAFGQIQASFTYSVVIDSCDAWEVSFTNTTQGTPNTTYLWDFNNGNSSSLETPPNQWFYSNATGGPQTATLYAWEGTFFVDSITVVLNLSANTPQIDFTWTQNGGSCNSPLVVVFDAFDQNPNSNVSQWLWYIDGITAGSGQLLTYTFQQSGTHIIELFGYYGNGCVATYSNAINITANNNMQGGFTYNIINSNCSGALIDLFSTVSGGTAPYTYQWSWYDFGSSTVANPQQVGVISFDPTVYLTITDANGCTFSTSQYIQFNSTANLNPAISHQILSDDCTDTEIQFYGTGDNSIVAWDWTFFDGFNNTSVATVQNPIATFPTASGYVNAVLTVYDANNCSSVEDYIIVLDSLGLDGTADITFGSSCSGTACDATAILVPFGGDAPYLYSIDQGTPGTDPVFTNLCDGFYEGRIEDANGCVVEFNFTIQSAQNALSMQSYEYYESCNDSNIVGNGSFIQTYGIGGTAPYTYSWSNGETTPNIFNMPAGTYTVIITDAAGCSVSETFIVPVDDCFTISGYVYVDANGDCILDANDYGLSSTWVDLADANGNWLWIYDYTDANGYFEIQAPAGTYYFDVNGFNTSSYVQQCPGANFTVTVDANNPSATVNFFMIPPPPTQDLSVSIGHITNVAPSTIPGQNRWSYISYCNDGTIPMSGTVVWNYSPELIYAGPGWTNITPDIIDQVNHQLTFNFSNLLPGDCEYVRINFDVPNLMQIGTVINDEAIINPIPGDVTPANNTAYTSVLSVGILDPNDKAVYPNGDITVDDNDHDYHIRFQNEGNANATRVIVRDVLDDNLDLKTLRNVNSSHNFILTFENDNELVFTFDNIQLPPKDVDEPGSQGYISFTITQLEDLQIGTSIENTADIYFDFNPAVVTNTVVNTIVDKASGINDNDLLIGAEIYPNPSTGFINVSVGEEVTIEDIIVFDVIGNQVLAASEAQNNNLQLNLSQTSAGVYFIQINTDKGSTVKRLVLNTK